MGEACITYGYKCYRGLVRTPVGKRPLGKPRLRWENNIKMDLQEVGWGGHELNGSGSG
jgi:hypothetical protein